MKDLKDTFSNKAVYLKMIVLALCFFALVMWTCHPARFGDKGFEEKQSGHGQYFEMMVLGTGGYMIIMLLLVVIYIADESDRIFEILFLIGGIIVDLGGGIWIVIEAISYDGNWVPLLLGALMIAAGIVMIVDIVRAIQSD